MFFRNVGWLSIDYTTLYSIITTDVRTSNPTYDYAELYDFTSLP
jgi:hypothetical protein